MGLELDFSNYKLKFSLQIFKFSQFRPSTDSRATALLRTDSENFESIVWIALRDICCKILNTDLIYILNIVRLSCVFHRFRDILFLLKHFCRLSKMFCGKSRGIEYINKLMRWSTINKTAKEKIYPEQLSASICAMHLN